MRAFVAVIVGVWCCLAIGEEPTASATASTAFEGLRDAKHREEIRVVWPDGPDAPLPDNCDVLLIRGYISSACLRFYRQGGGPICCDRVTLSRTWFYNPDGEQLAFSRTEIDPNRFAVAWAAVMRILEVQCEPLHPPPPPVEHQAVETPDGEWVEIEASGDEPMPVTTMSSHAPHQWLCISQARTVVTERYCRGERFIGDIQDQNDLQHRAIQQVFDDLVADKSIQWKPFEPSDWNDYLQCGLVSYVATFRAAKEGGWKEDIDESVTEPCKAMLRILGVSGDEDAEKLISELASLAPPQADDLSLYDARSVGLEARLAEERTRLRLHWDVGKATEAIHGNAGRWHAQSDQEQWLRTLFHNRDPERYLALILADLRSDNPRLVITSINELDRYESGRFLSDLQPLLEHADPNVTCVAAFVMLGVVQNPYHETPERAAAVAQAAERAKHDDRVREAWMRIERLASAPKTPIAAGTRGFHRTAREMAVRLLSSKACPPPWQWDRQRVREQIANPSECDARYVEDLLAIIGTFPLTSEVSFDIRDGRKVPVEPERSELIAIWRRCLAKPYTRGTLLAISELAALGDHESMPLARSILEEIEGSCADLAAVGEGAKGKQYPWIDRYDLKRLRSHIDRLTSQ